MALHIVRFTTGSMAQWGLLQGEKVLTLNTDVETTGELLTLGYDEIHRCLKSHGEIHDSKSVSLLSPITSDNKVLCQGANYRQHMIDSGMDPDAKTFNMFFTKSSASITAPQGNIIKPDHVQLLDYEVELCLVIGKKSVGPVSVDAENLHEYVAGVCIGNDVSARDIQIPQMQFHKGKSYRTFCPLGPVLCLLAEDEMHYLDDLHLELSVNTEIRQRDHTANMVFKPAETLTEMSTIHDFEPGDILMTGTPSGCALQLPRPILVKVTSLLPDAKRWSLFRKSQAKSKRYLQPGNIIESRIYSSDGKVHLGVQRHVVTKQ